MTSLNARFDSNSILSTEIPQVSNPLDDAVRQVAVGQARLEVGATSEPDPTLVAAASGLPAAPQDQVFDLRSLTGQVRGRFNTESITADYNNTVGLYRINDAEGTVTDPSDSRTYRPSDPGYREAALRRSQADGANFSARAGQVEVTLQGGSIYAPFLVANDTFANALANSATNVFFNFTGANAGQFDYFRFTDEGRIAVEDILGGGDLDFNDAIFGAQFEAVTPPPLNLPPGEEQIFDTRPFAGQRVRAIINTQSITADYNNTVALYRIEDVQGTVIDPTNGTAYRPGDAEYQLAAFRRAQADGANFSARAGDITLELQGGALYAPFVISNNTLENALSNPGGVDVFFNYVAANADGFDHYIAAEGGRIAVEDIVGGGDLDFNDAIFGVRFEAIATPTPTPTPVPPGGTTELFDLRSLAGQRLNVGIDSEVVTTTFSNSIGLYRVEDAEGTVIDPLNGTAFRPGDAEYNLAAARRSQADGIDFISGTEPTNIQIQGGFLYAPYMIVNGTLAEFLTNSRTFNIFHSFVGANSDGFDHFRTLADGRIGVEDLLGGGDQDFDDAIFRLTFQPPAPLPAAPQDQVFDLSAQQGRVRVLINSQSITADFNNTVGLYPIEDVQGTVIDPTDGRSYRPGEPGYILAIVRRSQADGITFNDEAGDVANNLDGGRVYGTFLISNGTVADVLGGAGTKVFSNFIAANEDGLDHFQTLGPNQFAIEDQLNNGDQDFNDAIVTIRVETV